jgi:hypothetical protein
MSTVTVPRRDLTTEEVVTVLRDGLGARYNVLPGMAIGRSALRGPSEGRPNMILVGTGDSRIVKAQVTITGRGGQTELRISPGGISWDLLLNALGVARKIRRVLASCCGNRGRLRRQPGAVSGTRDVSAALARYDRQRRARTQAMSRTATRQVRFGHQLQAAIAVALRNTAVGLTPNRVALLAIARYGKWHPPALA